MAVAPGLVLKAGTTLVRQWRGHTHTVLVHKDGFEHEGQRYRKLRDDECSGYSAVAGWGAGKADCTVASRCAIKGRPHDADIGHLRDACSSTGTGLVGLGSGHWDRLDVRQDRLAEHGH